MSDYISRQAAIEALAGWKISPIVLDPVPSADVVEVVRCKDCKYAEVADPEDNQDGYICQFHRGCIWFSGSYCSWAERAEERKDEGL